MVGTSDFKDGLGGELIGFLCVRRRNLIGRYDSDPVVEIIKKS